jgi:hypothetical protein
VASFDFNIPLENAPSKVLVDRLVFVHILLVFNPKLFPHQLNYVIHLLNLYPISSSPDLGCTLMQALLSAFFLWYSD